MMSIVLTALLLLPGLAAASDDSTRLLRQPDISATQIAFVYGGDIWTAARSGADVRRLTQTAEAESYPRFSPDGRLIAFTRQGDVYVMPAAGGRESRLTWHPQADTAVGWTPDGRHIIICSDRWKGDWNFHPHVFLLPVEGGWPEPLPVPRATRASFSPDGSRFAYGPVPEAVFYQPFRNYRGGSLAYIATFDPGTKTYQELPRGNWNDIGPMWRGDAIYFLSDRDGSMNIYRYALSSKATVRLTSHTEWDVRNASANGDTIVYENGGWLYLLDLATRRCGRLSLVLPPEATAGVAAADRAQWQQAVEDVWSLYQEKAFRPAAAWSGIKGRYLELMKSAADWSDADVVLKQMLSEAGQSHLSIGRPRAGALPARSGLLGADFHVEQGRYRIAKIYRGNAADKQTGPLAVPDLGVREGDYLLAVNGATVSGSVDIYSHLTGLAGSSVRLSIADSPSGPAREITVRPIADEHALRYSEWVRGNAERVATASGGRIGYLHVADVDRPGVEQFRRDWRALRGKVAAMIIDERNNTGGTQTLDILDWLVRPPVRTMVTRRGPVPHFVAPESDGWGGWSFLDGPKVMIANEQSVSGGDELAYYFQMWKLGPLVGTRTMGGMIGTSGLHKVTGGWMMGIPEIGFFYPQSGQWAPENRGVEPDSRVEWTPADLAAHRDPQLEEAIGRATAALATYRKQVPEIPPYPAGR